MRLLFGARLVVDIEAAGPIVAVSFLVSGDRSEVVGRPPDPREGYRDALPPGDPK